MQAHAGLRERKRERTREAISSAAISLFLAHGFDKVSVAQIAAAAEVSKPTLFKYFASKEELVLHRIADHRGEAARVVRERRPGESPLDALRRHFLDGLARRDPVTGLNDHPEVLAYHRMIFETPSLLVRAAQYAEAEERELADALAATAVPGDPTADRAPSPAGDPPVAAPGLPADPLGHLLAARLTAAQVVAVQRVLARAIWRRLVDGESADRAYPAAVSAAEQAFDLLACGLEGMGSPHPG
ncbi:helix-turn-helix domain-containing protein [Micromonospora sp. NPDC049559]|uniref:TetR/AcrR family transcriptional regulator n=1 Tax=Micromonospora sp. NPDC049559 TaxID=3155923 RepID=UPI0034426025